MKTFITLVRSGITLFLFVILALVTATPAASQTIISKVIVTSVNVNETFPEVTVQVKAVDAVGAFIPGITADKFSINEDGMLLPTSEVTSASLPLNMHIVFVIDELAITSRLTIVREAIQSFAQNQMQAGDSIEVLAAGENGKVQTIVPLTSDSNQIVDGMQEAKYNPTAAASTDLLGTVKQGLSDLSALSENTEGIDRIVVFSVSIINQIDLDKTINRANQLEIPIHTILLGFEDAEKALGRLARETKAGKGAILPDDLNDVLDGINAQRDQTQYLIRYRSRANQDGAHELVLKIDGVASNDVTFAIDKLEPPLIRITAPTPDTIITRSETLFNQNTEKIQPTEQTVAVEVSWPDGHERDIVIDKTALVLNGKSVGPATVIRDNGKDPVILEFTWDLREESIPGENAITVVIEAEDELGLKSKSEPLAVTVNYVQLDNACPPLISDNIPAMCSNLNLILPLASLLVAVAALILVIIFLRRNPQIQKQVKARLLTLIPGKLETRIVDPTTDSAKAILVVLEGNSGTKQTEFRINSTTTLGRSAEYAQLVFQADREGSPISRLHCTLVEKDGAFDVRDEGSPNGSYLNGVRLKQSELHHLSDGDALELARVVDGGLKLKFQAVLRPGYLGTRIVAPKSDGTAEEPPSDGYTPTKIVDKK